MIYIYFRFLGYQLPRILNNQGVRADFSRWYNQKYNRKHTRIILGAFNLWKIASMPLLRNPELFRFQMCKEKATLANRRVQGRPWSFEERATVPAGHFIQRRAGPGRAQVVWLLLKMPGSEGVLPPGLGERCPWRSWLRGDLLASRKRCLHRPAGSARRPASRPRAREAASGCPVAPCPPAARSCPPGPAELGGPGARAEPLLREGLRGPAAQEAEGAGQDWCLNQCRF